MNYKQITLKEAPVKEVSYIGIFLSVSTSTAQGGKKIRRLEHEYTDFYTLKWNAIIMK